MKLSSKIPEDDILWHRAHVSVIVSGPSEPDARFSQAPYTGAYQSGTMKVTIDSRMHRGSSQ